MESLGYYLTFRNRPKNRKKEPVKVLTLKQEPRKKPVKVLDSETGTENRTESEKLLSPRYKEGGDGNIIYILVLDTGSTDSEK